jgi:predicted  nucleic acid-binding Zn-ribbon protein
MQDLQQIFNHIQEIKKKQKDIKSAYRDALNASEEYKNLLDKLKELRARKKQIEVSVKQDFSSEFQKLDDYKVDLESDNTMLSDAALTKLMKGETVEVTDEYNNNYEPIFTVKFKKT